MISPLPTSRDIQPSVVREIVNVVVNYHMQQQHKKGFGQSEVKASKIGEQAERRLFFDFGHGVALTPPPRHQHEPKQPSTAANSPPSCRSSGPATDLCAIHWRHPATRIRRGVYRGNRFTPGRASTDSIKPRGRDIAPSFELVTR